MLKHINTGSSGESLLIKIINDNSQLKPLLIVHLFISSSSQLHPLLIGRHL
jgi:hypothetical protein